MNLMQQNNNLELFFQKDVIDLKDYPSEDIKRKVNKMQNSVFDFHGVNKLVAREVKMFLQMVLKQNYLKATVRQYVRTINLLVGFLQEHPHITTLETVAEDLKDLYKKFLEKKGYSATNARNNNTPYYAILFRLNKFVVTDYGHKSVFEREIWALKYISIDESRILKTGVKELSFIDLPDGENKEILKKYVQYLLLNTDQSSTTIYAKSTNIQGLLFHLGNNKLLSEIDRDDAETFMDSLENKKLINHTFNIYLNHINEFIEYLITRDIINSNVFYGTDKKRYDRKHAYRAINDTVIDQIFSKLDKIPFEESCMFLILYTTGMRVSDMCSLNIDVLKNDKDKCFLKYYSSKMRKEVINYIPQSLYELLIRHRNDVKTRYGATNSYLFLNSVKGPYNPNTFRQRLNKWFNELAIKNPDGTEYIFKAHDYRHTLATNMIINDIPSAVIQKVLHHESIEMTAAYTDIQDEDKKNDYKKFIDIKGEYIPLETAENFSIDNLAEVEWLKKTIHAQMLPNGMCSLPVAMGKCPHANSCLTCGHFRTGDEFLPVHERHYERVCSLIDYAKEEGWQRQVETNEEVKKNLETIISTLKA